MTADSFFDPHLANLAAVLEFGPDDLDHNQAGHLTPAQIKRVHNDLRCVYWPFIGALSLLAFVFGAVSASSGSFAFFPVGVLMAAALAVAAVFRQQHERLHHHPARSAMLRLGRLSLTMRRWQFTDDDNPLQATFVVEGGTRLFAPRAVYKTLRANWAYRVYFAPVRTWSGHRILSIEPLAELTPRDKRRAAPRRKRKKTKRAD
jgi:hypothetical protein